MARRPHVPPVPAAVKWMAFLGWLALIVVGFFMALIFGVPMAMLAG